MKDYSSIFNKYNTEENIPFFMLNKKIEFPSDRKLYIYDTLVVSSDTPWTTLSYQIYDTIDYWWVLCLLNPSFLFYAPDGETIYFIKEEYLFDLLSFI